MGGKFGIFRHHGIKIGPLNLSDRDYAILKKLWSEIEAHPQKYGRGIYMRFFAQFPKYIKYFTEEKSAPYEDSHRVNDKFTLILASLGYMIIDFYKEPKKFDSMLDYVAMIHKDMHLKAEDFNNFTQAVIQHLKVVMPDIMTDECAKIYSIFMEDLTHQLVTKMVKNRTEISNEIGNQNRSYYPCRWFNQRDKVVYGHAKSYWIARRTRWQVKMQRWESGSGITEANTLYNLLNGLNHDNDEQLASGSPPLLQQSQTIEPHAQGSVMSQIVHEKIWNDEKETVFKTGTLRSRSSQILKDIGRQSTAAAIILAGNKETSTIQSELTARERFRNRRIIENDQKSASISNNQKSNLEQKKSEKVETEVTERQLSPGFSGDLDQDKTDH